MRSFKLCASVALGGAVAGLTVARQARADEVVVPDGTVRTTEVVVPDTRVRAAETRPSRAMLSSGLVVLGVPYVSSVIVAASSDHPGDHNLYIPVAGPWMDLADRHCANGSNCTDGFNKGMLVVDGIFQGIGALQILSAFLFPEPVTVISARAKLAPPAVARVQIGPAGLGTGYGLAAVGAF
jgi:hypothetical protein